jgi:predicted PhzF superfamily epimerase YddE/YHI9
VEASIIDSRVCNNSPSRLKSQCLRRTWATFSTFLRVLQRIQMIVHISRVFSPTMLLEGEDPVCGTAHCLLNPYWCVSMLNSSEDEAEIYRRNESFVTKFYNLER